MSYYEDVYLKRMNKDGRTRQERIKARKEKEFEKLTLQKSIYQAEIISINLNSSSLVCSLQPNKWNEAQIISNLLLPTSAPVLNTGDILTIFQKIDTEEYVKQWLILFCEQNISKGYALYKVICLDQELNLTDEYGETQHVIPVKFVNSLREISQDTVVIDRNNPGYAEPHKLQIIITKDFDFLQKHDHFKYKDREWKIIGKNNINIDGVCYFSIEETLVSPPEPISSKDILVGSDDNFFLNNT